MIDTVIFDIGGVLTDYREKDYFGDFGYPAQTCERLRRASTLAKEWNEYDLGNLTDEEIIGLFQKNDPSVARELEVSLYRLTNLVLKKEYAVPWIRSIKKTGRRVLFLSNFSYRAEVDCADALDFIPETDGGILSYKYHVVKPDPAIYQLITDKYGLTPGNCVFIDDRQENIDGGARQGFRTILFKSYEQANAELEELFLRG